ncbi:MAG: type I 3-dehydroquinate dehydratase [Lactococcus plantarum]|nr:type I 3-dehydroquinate dehydratase [Lactococcus plantarum]MDN6070023.1 type I 3-dehydroquinate dehydratase [Lactococcus plantarum]MDN6085068.1 type I 3-dehydroquinate dehydratase [Lactococcus plantarum]
MKIVVPIMPRSIAEIALLETKKYEEADIIEWRADFLPLDVLSIAAQKIKQKFLSQEIIFTYRTEDKSDCKITELAYANLIATYASEFTYIDVEVMRFKTISLPDNAIASYHDFDQIPRNLSDILSTMSARQPKVVKFAGMPKTKTDVLRLMSETLAFSLQHPQQLFVTMAMGELGKITRLAGNSFGSSWTFASVDASSAPGQFSLSEMLQAKTLLN